MDKHQILTDEELAMLQDLGDAEDMAAFAALDTADGRIGPDPLTFG